MAVGLLAWNAAAEVSLSILPGFRNPHMLAASAVVGALVALTPLRVWMMRAAGFLAFAMLAVGYNPLVDGWARSLQQRDPLEKCPAVLVLSSDIRKDGELDGASQGRFLHGIQLIQQGWAPRMIITRLPWPKPSYREGLNRFVADLRLPPLELVETGRVRNTHDEAVEVGRLVADRGWNRVILVSDPHHMRRAQALFRKAGVNVICSPCRAREYDANDLKGPGDRIRAWRDVLYETTGFWWYRMRGWL